MTAALWFTAVLTGFLLLIIALHSEDPPIDCGRGMAYVEVNGRAGCILASEIEGEF